MRGIAVVSVVVVIAVVAAGTGGAVPAAVTQPSIDETPMTATTAASNHSNASLGSQLSSFIQSNTAQASGSVETGMWVAAYENASNQSRQTLVTRRTNQLDQRIDELEAEKRALQAAKRNGSISAVEYRSRLSRILGRLAALREGIEAVDRPDAPGLNKTAIRAINKRADGLAGPEISEIARSLGGPGASPGPPSWVETRPGADGGPGQNPGGQGTPPDPGGPDDAGPPPGTGNGTANGGAGNGSTTGSGDGAANGGGDGEGDGKPGNDGNGSDSAKVEPDP